MGGTNWSIAGATGLGTLGGLTVNGQLQVTAEASVESYIGYGGAGAKTNYFTISNAGTHYWRKWTGAAMVTQMTLDASNLLTLTGGLTVGSDIIFNTAGNAPIIYHAADAATILLRAGSTADYVSSIVISGRGASDYILFTLRSVEFARMTGGGAFSLAGGLTTDGDFNVGGNIIFASTLTRPTVQFRTTGYSDYHRLSSYIGESVALTTNAYYDGSNWQRDNTGAFAARLELGRADEMFSVYMVAAAANPITWGTRRFSVDISGNGVLAGGASIGATGTNIKCMVGHAWDGTAYSSFIGKPDASQGTGAGSAFIAFVDSLAEDERKGTNIDFYTHNYGVAQSRCAYFSGDGNLILANSLTVGTTIQSVDSIRIFPTLDGRLLGFNYGAENYGMALDTVNSNLKFYRADTLKVTIGASGVTFVDGLTVGGDLSMGDADRYIYVGTGALSRTLYIQNSGAGGASVDIERYLTVGNTIYSSGGINMQGGQNITAFGAGVGRIGSGGTDYVGTIYYNTLSKQGGCPSLLEANLVGMEEEKMSVQLENIKIERYRFKDTNKHPETFDLGFNLDSLPNVLKWFEKGTAKGLKLNSMIAFLAKSVQEQQETINKLKVENEEIKKKLGIA